MKMVKLRENLRMSKDYIHWQKPIFVTATYFLLLNHVFFVAS